MGYGIHVRTYHTAYVIVLCMLSAYSIHMDALSLIFFVAYHPNNTTYNYTSIRQQETASSLHNNSAAQ